MKKFLTLITILFFSLSSYGHCKGNSFNNHGNRRINHSGIFLNPTVGLLTGDLDEDLGVDLTLGYRFHIVNGFSWDIAKIGFSTGVSDAQGRLTMRFLSGLRYNSPAMFGGKSLYADCAFGYSFLTDETDFGGFAYEVGAGINLSRKVSLGIVWEGNNPRYSWVENYVDNYYEYTIKANYGTIGFRLGLNF